MRRPELTFVAAWAIATDRANARMREAGRTCWDRGDYNHAVHVMETLLPEEEP